MKKLLMFVAAIAILFTSCKKGTIEMSAESVTLNKGQEYSISATSDKPITYASLNDFHALVSDNGVVTANFVGKTNITLKTDKDSKSFAVNVAPVSNLYEEPELNFGMTKSAVIEKYGEPYYESHEEGTDTYLYAYLTYNEKAPMFAILVTNGHVEGYAVYVEYSEMVELATFIEERYNFVMEQDGIKVYVNALSLQNTTLLVAKYLEFYGGEPLVYDIVYTQYSSKSGADEVVKKLSSFGKDLLVSRR